MNLLALRTLLQTPDTIFAPLILVDAVIAYSWMALLVAASGAQQQINHWLRAIEDRQTPTPSTSVQAPAWNQTRSRLVCIAIAVSLAFTAHAISASLPTSSFLSSSSGWTVLLVTTVALGLSLLPPIQRLGTHGSALGYPCLYLVLAATGAQADLGALRSAPIWIVLGAGIALVHGSTLLLAGRCWRLPLGLLATASQANIGGVVSAPLVAAVYDQSLAPIGLLLALAGNALGTYLGWLAALLCRWLLSIGKC